MDIHELATSFLDLRTRRDEKRRFIDYDQKKKLSELEKNRATVDEKLKIINFKNEIQLDEEIFVQLNEDLTNIIDELSPLLSEVNATRNDPLITPVEKRSFFDVWLDEEGKIQSAGVYTKLG